MKRKKAAPQKKLSLRKKTPIISVPPKSVSVEQLHHRIGQLRQRIQGALYPSLPQKNSPLFHVRVFRFNAGMDFVPRTHEYSIEKIAGESVLDLLTRLKHTQDGSLTFRASCGNGGCGTCGVRVNGKPVLGCVTQVSDALAESATLRIDPLNENEVIRDLVCSEKDFFNQFEMVKPFLVPRKSDAQRHHRMLPQEVEALGNAQQCILCGICNANAHAPTHSSSEWGPAAMVKGYRYWKDIRDGDITRVREMKRHIVPSYSLEKANLCPRDIFPGKKIEAIMKEKTPPVSLKREKRER